MFKEDRPNKLSILEILLAMFLGVAIILFWKFVIPRIFYNDYKVTVTNELFHDFENVKIVTDKGVVLKEFSIEQPNFVGDVNLNESVKKFKIPKSKLKMRGKFLLECRYKGKLYRKEILTSRFKDRCSSLYVDIRTDLNGVFEIYANRIFVAR